MTSSKEIERGVPSESTNYSEEIIAVDCSGCRNFTKVQKQFNTFIEEKSIKSYLPAAGSHWNFRRMGLSIFKLWSKMVFTTPKIFISVRNIYRGTLVQIFIACSLIYNSALPG